MAFDPKSYFVGAGKVYYRAIGSTGAWTDIGVLLDDISVHIKTSWFSPDNLAGQLAPLRGLDYLDTQHAEIEFTMAEIGSSKLALPVPNMVTTTRATTDATGTPGTTTLAAAAAPGDLTVKVVANTNFTAGDYIRINVGGALAEYRQIDVAGSVGAAGTGLQFRKPLLKAHASGVAVVETIGDGKTVITPSAIRRQPDASYNDWVVDAQSGVDFSSFFLFNGFSMVEDATITYGDTTLAGISVTVRSSDDGTGTLPTFRLEV